MAYNVTSGEIVPGILYMVKGAQSVTYNSTVYPTGQRFRGVKNIKTFSYSGSGSQEVNEILELNGGAIGFNNSGADASIYHEMTLINGMSVEYSLSDAEHIVNEVTQIKGFSIELTDFPFYSFEITEIRL